LGWLGDQGECLVCLAATVLIKINPSSTKLIDINALNSDLRVDTLDPSPQ